MSYTRRPDYSCQQRSVGEALEGMAEMMGRAPGRPGAKVEEPEGDGPPHERGEIQGNPETLLTPAWPNRKRP